MRGIKCSWWFHQYRWCWELVRWSPRWLVTQWSHAQLFSLDFICWPFKEIMIVCVEKQRGLQVFRFVITNFILNYLEAWKLSPLLSRSKEILSSITARWCRSILMVKVKEIATAKLMHILSKIRTWPKLKIRCKTKYSSNNNFIFMQDGPRLCMTLLMIYTNWPCR